MLKAHSEKREYRHKKKDLKLMKKVCFQLNSIYFLIVFFFFISECFILRKVYS